MPDEDKSKADSTHNTDVKTSTPKIEESHTKEAADPVERLPEDPEKQNDLA